MRFDRYHQHFVSRQGPRDRLFTDEPGTPAGDGGAGGTAEISGGSSFEDIGRAAYEASGSSEPGFEGDSGEAPASPGEPATGVEEGAEGGESTAAEKAANLLASVQGEAMKLSPEELPEELRPFIKQFQADYTRKTQELAEQRKRSAEELAGDEIATLRAEIDALKGGRQPSAAQPSPQEAPDLDGFARARVEAELGSLISDEDFFAAQDNATVTRYLQQQTMLAATRAVAEYHMEVVSPHVGRLDSALSNRQQAEVRSTYDAFVSANPDLVPYEAEVAGLFTAGKTLDQAAAMVRKAITADDAVTRAMATGAQIGEARAKQVATAKDNFSVPHGSTAGKGGTKFSAGDSWSEIAEQAAREAGVL